MDVSAGPGSVMGKSRWGKREFVFTFCVLPRSLLFQRCSFFLTRSFSVIGRKQRSAYGLNRLRQAQHDRQVVRNRQEVGRVPLSVSRLGVAGHQYV